MGSPKPYRLFNLDSAMKFKESVNIPVIVVGGIDCNYCLIGGEVRPLKYYYVKVSN